MAKPYICCSPRHNLLLAGKDEVNGGAPIEGSGTSTPTRVVSYAPPSTFISASIPISAARPALTNELFK